MRVDHVVKVGVLCTSDTHGLFDGSVSVDELRSEFKRMKDAEECDGWVIIDNGDTLQGSSRLHYYALNAKENHPFHLYMKELEYDSFVPGNHDFDYGKTFFASINKESTVPFVCANIMKEEGKIDGIRPYIIKEIHGLKVAVIGITLRVFWEDPLFEKEGWLIADEWIVVQRLLDHLKASIQPDLIIVSYHGGLDDQVGERNVGEQLSQLNEIDLLITGHQHQLINDNQGDGPIVIQAGKCGEKVGCVTFDFVKRGSQYIKSGYRAELNDIHYTQKKEKDEVSDWFNHPFFMHHYQEQKLSRLQMEETCVSRWVHEAICHEAGGDVTIFSLSAQELAIPSRVIDRKTLFELYPYPDRLYYYSLSREEIKHLLEISASMYDPTLEIAQSWRTPHPLYYQFAIAGGADYEIDVSKPVGERVTLKLSPMNNYTVAVTAFLVQRATKYHPFFAKRKPVYKVDVTMPALLESYARKTLTLQSVPKPKWKVVKDVTND
ncbi:bifunctional metallophosphatase/5'-nucleotidase [Alkalihalobacillus hemicellulosilyticus]|uniref:2',3'-cyclic-nucleotide 2'-phosphodiesterase n=1 Tax=Halalkalibacter hemicellulosilyticusJCM 9152 TaxID=1236971 RepID=W4QIR9_9BACI|nr:5'-nucleotidase C-terminal domain-containing protein [Halalkalibacter hemicellulosilyticus]GAE31812.1 2',3'-cyclic-nucleotide 2'-phosphodiesterase [Halalkalibacter hemicellulosilyticusJCM 9152]